MAKGRHAGTKRFEFVVTKDFYKSLKEIALSAGLSLKELLERFFQYEFEQRQAAYEHQQSERKRLIGYEYFKTYWNRPLGPQKPPHGWDSVSPRTYGWSGWGGKGTKRIYLHLPPDVYRAMSGTDLKKLLFRIKEWRRSRACDGRLPLEQVKET